MKKKGKFLVITLVALIVICGNVVARPEGVGIEINELKAELVAHYAFDELSGITALDSSGNDHHGTVIGASRVEGVSGGGLLFGADNTRVSVGDFLVFDNGLISIEALIKPNRIEMGETYRIIGGYDYQGFYFQIRDGRLEVLYDGQSYHYGTTQIPVDVWTRIAFTSDGRNITTYINAVEDKKSNITLPIKIFENINIGANEIYTGGSPLIDYVEEFHGIIDELKIRPEAYIYSMGKFHWSMFLPAIINTAKP